MTTVSVTPCRLRRDSATAPITQANVRLAVLLSVPGLWQDMDLYEATSGNDKDGNWRNCKLIETQADTRVGRSFDETEACGACSCFSIMMMYRVCVSIVTTVCAMQESADHSPKVGSSAAAPAKEREMIRQVGKYVPKRFKEPGKIGEASIHTPGKVLKIKRVADPVFAKVLKYRRSGGLEPTRSLG